MSNRIRAKKRFSQNFFQDPDALVFCLEMLDLCPEDTVLEIGPGRGILTEELLKRAKHVHAIEIDRDLFSYLERHFLDHPRLSISQGDFMNYDLKEFVPEIPTEQRKLIANIPYHLTSLILMKALNEKVFKQGIDTHTAYFGEIALMVQKEVAERLEAVPGSKAWGALSISTQFAAEVEIVAILPKEMFKPQPKVDSAFVRLVPRREMPINPQNLAFFWRMVRKIFQLRRKTLRNVFKGLGMTPENLDLLGSKFDLRLRGETLDLVKLEELSNLSAPLIDTQSLAQD